MLKNEGQFLCTSNYTLSSPHVNRQFSNNIDSSAIIDLILTEYTPGDLATLNTLLYLSNKHEQINIAIDCIAQKSDIAHITVRRAIKKLVKHNLLRIYRFGGPAVYVLADEFRYHTIREALKQILTAMNYVPRDGILFRIENERAIILNNNNTHARERLSHAIDDNWQPSCMGALKADQFESVSKGNPHKQTIEEGVMIENESCIPPHIKEIPDSEVQLSFGERYQLAKYSQAVITKARQILRRSPMQKRSFHYLRGICEKMTKNTVVSDNGTKELRTKQRYAWRTHPDSGLGYPVNLEVEREERKLMELGNTQHYLRTHTSGSAMIDAYYKKAFLLDHDMKAAEEEFLRLSKEGFEVRKFLAELEELAQWDLKEEMRHVDDLILEWTGMQEEITLAENGADVHGYMPVNTHKLFD